MEITAAFHSRRSALTQFSPSSDSIFPHQEKQSARRRGSADPNEEHLKKSRASFASPKKKSFQDQFKLISSNPSSIEVKAFKQYRSLLTIRSATKIKGLSMLRHKKMVYEMNKVDALLSLMQKQ